MPILIVLFLFIALALFLLARRTRRRTGLPFHARIVYADTGAWKQVEKPLFSKRYALAGKPDYLVAENDLIIPIEVKPNRVAPQPLESDIMQLAVYGLLVEENWQRRPPYGLLKYRDAVYRIEFDEETRGALLEVMDALRRDADAREVARNHDQARRCRACGYRAECGQALQAES